MNNSKIGFSLKLIFSVILSALIYIVPQTLLPVMLISGIFFASACFILSKVKAAIVVGASLLACAVASLWGGFSVDGIFTAISNFCLVCLPGALIGSLAKRKADFRMVISGGALGLLGSFLTEFILYKFYYKLNITDVLINKPISDFFSVYKEVMSGATVPNAEEVLKVAEEMQWYVQQAMATIIPSALIIVCGLASLILFVLSRKYILARYGVPMGQYPLFSHLQMPRFASLLLALLYIATFFMGASNLSGAITNIVIIMSSVYMLCGLSVIDFLLQKRGMRWILRCLIYVAGLLIFAVLGLVLPFANIFTILLFVGVIDGMLDFRRIRLPKDYGGENK